MDSELHDSVNKKQNNITIIFWVKGLALIGLLSVLVSVAGYYLVRSYNLQSAATMTQIKLTNSLYNNLDNEALTRPNSELSLLGVEFEKVSSANAVVLIDTKGKRVWASKKSALVNLKKVNAPLVSFIPLDLFQQGNTFTIDEKMSNAEYWHTILSNDDFLLTQQVEIYSKSKKLIGSARLATDVSFVLKNTLFISCVLFLLVWLCCFLLFYRFYKTLKKFIKTIDKQEKILNDNVSNLSSLLESNQTMRSNIETASSRAVELNEQFLRRVGADLHDGPAQMIGYANLRLSKIAQMDVAKELGSEFNGVRQALEDSLEEIRGISSGLVLPELETMTLEQCMRKVVSIHGVQSKAKIKQNYIDIPDDVPLPIKICAYRFVQEGLNNAEQHGGAEKCRLSVRYNKGSLQVSLKDNGVGFRTSTLRNDSVHLGLIGLKDRIESIGGKFQINSELGSGTAIKFTVAC